MLIADDRTVVRTGLRALLSSDPTVEVVAETEAEAAVERSRIDDVDVVLIDLRFADGFYEFSVTSRTAAVARGHATLGRGERTCLAP